MFAIRYLGSDNFSFRTLLFNFPAKMSWKMKDKFLVQFKKKLDLPIVFVQKHIIWRKTPLDRKGVPSPKLNVPFPIHFYHIPQHIIFQKFQKGGIWSLFLETKILGINTISRKTILRSFPQLLVRWQLSVDKDKHCICTGTTFWYNKVRCKTWCRRVDHNCLWDISDNLFIFVCHSSNSCTIHNTVLPMRTT